MSALDTYTLSEMGVWSVYTIYLKSNFKAAGQARREIWQKSRGKTKSDFFS